MRPRPDFAYVIAKAEPFDSWFGGVGSQSVGTDCGWITGIGVADQQQAVIQLTFAQYAAGPDERLHALDFQHARDNGNCDRACARWRQRREMVHVHARAAYDDDTGSTYEPVCDKVAAVVLILQQDHSPP